MTTKKCTCWTTSCSVAHWKTCPLYTPPAQEEKRKECEVEWKEYCGHEICSGHTVVCGEPLPCKKHPMPPQEKELESKDYQPVPVSTARTISEVFKKDMVVIVSWDFAHNKLHTTTFGKTEKDKHIAAKIGDAMPNKILQLGTQPENPVEDFRRDELEVACQEAAAKAREEVCICAAIKFEKSNGDIVIIRGHRHADCFLNISRREEKFKELKQGFITSNNRFVDREEGFKLMLAVGWKSASPDGYHGNQLYSEDLY